MHEHGGSTLARQPGGRGARALYPLKLEPILVERIWGADRLGRLHGMEHDHSLHDGARRSAPHAGQRTTPIGESWLLCDDNVVLNGAFAGMRVTEVIAQLGGDLLGSANLSAYGTKLALMAKFLDAAADLSIQVHPDDAYALSHEAATGHLGKAEAWYVLEAEPGARVVWGFRRPMSASEVRSQVADGTLGASLNHVPVAPGDVIMNEAGTVHAVGAGLMLFEIQQSSDLTYRLYDYGRRDAAGHLRELHLDKALAVADLRQVDPGAGLGGAVADETAAPAGQADGGWRLLVTTPQFTLESVIVREAAPPVSSTTAASFDLLVSVMGSVDVEPAPRVEGLTRHEGPVFDVVRLDRGDAALVPAALGRYRLSGSGEVLRSRVPSGG